MNLDIKKRIDTIANPEAIRIFFYLLHQLISDNNISPDNERLALNVRNDYRKRFSVNINSRLVLCIKNTEFALMINNEDLDKISDIQTLKTEVFEKQSPASLVYFSLESFTKNLERLRQLWLKSCAGYLPLQEKSQYRKHHIDELYNIAYNNSLLDTYLKDSMNIYQNFSDVIKAFIDYIKSSDSLLKGFSHKEFHKTYVWLNDAENIIGDYDYCHYELITRQRIKPNHIYIELHFNPELKKAIKKYLNPLSDDRFFWNDKHGDELSLALKETIEFSDEKILEKLENGLFTFETVFGDIVRNYLYSNVRIISEFKEWHIRRYEKEISEIDELTLVSDLRRIVKNGNLILSQLSSYCNSVIEVLKKELIQFDHNILQTFDVFLTELLNKIQSKRKIMSLNQILYGPPGTGKTYNTINRAVGIANPAFDLDQDRDSVKAEYSRLVEAGKIVFSTFHQSMSYEDFIEGIKPVMTEDEGELTYEVQNGIFKEICKTAIEINEITVVDNFDESWGKLIELVKEHIADDQLLKIGSWEYSLSTKESLKYSSLNSPSQYTFTITKQNIQDAFQHKQARPSGAFQKDMEDIVSYMKANLQLSDYNENTGLDEIKSNHKNYVLIIDEINRGNVSQIFGELITLIEEGKRLGSPEELKVILPYSKKEFGVPSNLYIIGTMNTADRSVEALDTALRRRFSFVEMMPDVSVVEKNKFQDIYPRAEIMQKINDRIELLLDKNYTLGHSYFIKDDFRASFKNEIIPLLQEYFYNDCGKIGLILGQGFVRCKEISKANPKSVFADFETKNEIEITKSYELIPFEDIDFDNAVQSLLG